MKLAVLARSERTRISRACRDRFVCSRVLWIRSPLHVCVGMLHRRACRFVGLYTGTVLRREETLSEAQANQQYLFDLNNHITIDGSQGGNVTRYMCAPRARATRSRSARGWARRVPLASSASQDAASSVRRLARLARSTRPRTLHAPLLRSLHATHYYPHRAQQPRQLDRGGQPRPVQARVRRRDRDRLHRAQANHGRRGVRAALRRNKPRSGYARRIQGHSPQLRARGAHCNWLDCAAISALRARPADSCTGMATFPS